jgi:hypothetical protein
MPKFSNFSEHLFLVTVLLLSSLVFAWGTAAGAVRGSILDTERHIGLDEIEPEMQAYCLTVFSGTEVEKFDFEVVSVIHNFKPDRDAILVKGTDERFIHAGVVAGCSGSPVYIDGRIAGALAFGWSFSKDPLYVVTPIKEMLEVGTGSSDLQKNRMRLSLDLSGPLDLARLEKQIISSLQQRRGLASSANLLPAPVIISGIGESANGEFNNLLGPLGLMTVAGLSGGSSEEDEQAELVPGACLVVPLVDGDIKVAVVGTVTEVIDGQVYGFGHHFLGYGAIDLPMAVGKVHTVVANTQRSFKLVSPVRTVGSLNFDEAAAIRGTIGKAAEMIPMTIEVTRYNDPEPKSYKCSVANNQLLTPLLLRASLYGAVLQRGNLPPEHTLRYRTIIELVDADTISYENISSNTGISELLTETMAPVALLMNNPFKPVKVKSIRCEVQELDEVLLAGIRSINLSDNTIEQGGRFSVNVFVESIRGPKKRYTFDLTVPEDLKPGEYDILITGGYGYYDFLTKSAQYRFIAENVDTLIEALNEILSIRRDRLYCMFVLGESGIALEKAELPDLPLTRALVLTDAKRTLRAQPYRHWLEQSMQTPGVIVGAQKIKITVAP